MISNWYYIFVAAIKFGDTLSYPTCIRLMNQLSQCQTPFQCAHGRPSVAPIVHISKLNQFDGENRANNYGFSVDKLSALTKESKILV